MERTAIRAEERTGLAVAVILHLALFAMLIVQRRLIERLQELISGERGAPAAD